jgi:hypothetical protein
VVGTTRKSQIYTNDRADLAQGLERDVSHPSAMEPSRESVFPGARDQAVARAEPSA